MLRIEYLTKIYGTKKAVDDLSLHVAPGEIRSFIAASRWARIISCRAAAR